MTMQFISVKSALKNLLENNAGGLFRVVGHQQQEKAAKDMSSNLPIVEVFYKRSLFPKNRGRYIGPASNEAQFNIWVTVSEPAEVDLSVLEDPISTPAERSAALAALKQAGAVADEKIDLIISKIWETLQDPRNLELGLSAGVMSDRWVDEVNKSDTNPRGESVIIEAEIPYSCTISEEPPGEEGLDITVINLENDINDDTNQKTGIQINN